MVDTVRRPSPDHPRPTFGRPSWTSLDGTWQFAEGSANDRPLALAYEARIEVPFPPESAASGLGLTRCDHPRYRRTFTASPAAGRRTLVHFEGVDHEARVWVNGQFVGGHTGGYTPFTLDITDALTDGENELVVAATDLARDLEVPRGKQDWHDSPHMIWYGRSSGIWRSVWLEDVPAVRLSHATWTTLDTSGHVSGVVRIEGWDDTQALDVEASFAHDGTPLGTVRTSASAEFTTRLGHPVDADTPALYWTPDNPALIDVRLRLLRGDEVLDEVHGYTGLRMVAASGGVELNGATVFSRLVLEQAYWPDTHFTAPSADALRAEAELIKSLGFNGLRMHQVSADPRFLRACDEAGLMVWADCPAAYVFSPRSLQATTTNLTELIARDHNHPCVVGWVPFNESWGVPEVASCPQQRDAVAAVATLARALDPTRLVIGNDGWQNVAGDVVGVHDYSHDAGTLAARYGDADAVAATLASGRPAGRALIVGAVPADAPVLLSEFGGVSLLASSDEWGYGTVPDADALVASVRALAGAVSPSGAVGTESGVAGFCWTQLTDCLQEQNGLAWPDRTPKAPAADIAAAIRGEGGRPGPA